MPRDNTKYTRAGIRGIVIGRDTDGKYKVAIEGEIAPWYLAEYEIEADSFKTNKERVQTMKVTQAEIDEVCERLQLLPILFSTARNLAFNLAKEKNLAGVNQIRGAFSGLLDCANRAVGLLEGLRGLV